MIEKRTVYITKYALTRGIIRCDDADVDNVGCLCKIEGSRYFSFFSPKEFYYNIYDAINDCKARKIKKIESLQKQIKKIEKLKFE